MVDIDETVRHRGSTARDSKGEEVGEVIEIYVDDDSGAPAWLLVDTGGEDGAGSHFVPIAGADLSGEGVALAFPRVKIEGAAGVRGDRHLDAEEERDLYLHYGMDREADRFAPDPGETDGSASEGAAAEGDVPSLVRGEEEFDINTERRPAERVRLRKYTVVEERPVTVAVEREQVDVSEEPLAPARGAMGAPGTPSSTGHGQTAPGTGVPGVDWPQMGPPASADGGTRLPLLAGAIAAAVGAAILAWRRRQRASRWDWATDLEWDLDAAKQALAEAPWRRILQIVALLGLVRFVRRRRARRAKRRRPPTVRDVMTTPAVHVQTTDTLDIAAVQMRHLDVGALPVCGPDGRLDGMLTDRDIVVRVVAEQRDPAVVTAAELMDRDPITIGASESLDAARERMRRHAIRRLPVLEGRRLVGMLSLADLVAHLDDDQAGTLVEDISTAP